MHQHKHQNWLDHFIEANLDWLAGVPCAFFSVSLSAALADSDSRSEVQRLLDHYVRDAGLKPAVTRCVAGALKYTRYDYFKRLLMRMIAKHAGQTTDTSQDHEYTDWDDVEAFVDEFVAALDAPAPRMPAPAPG